MELVAQKLRDTRSNIHERKVQFLDQHGFSALYRKGEWFYQRFHSHAELVEICSRHGWQIEEHLNDHAWGVRARKREQVLTREGYEEAIRYEFSLPVNAAGRTLDVLEVMLEAAAQVW